jgi:hypothetical protein
MRFISVLQRPGSGDPELGSEGSSRLVTARRSHGRTFHPDSAFISILRRHHQIAASYHPLRRLACVSPVAWSKSIAARNGRPRMVSFCHPLRSIDVRWNGAQSLFSLTRLADVADWALNSTFRITLEPNRL